jgi:hypothetical protein
MISFLSALPRQAAVVPPSTAAVLWPTGTTATDWNPEFFDDFIGAAGARPAAPWRDGDPLANGGVWRSAQISAQGAVLDGAGNLRVRAWREGTTNYTGYVITGRAPNDGGLATRTVDPGEGTVFVSARLNVENFRAFAAWAAWWMLMSGDGNLYKEIDLLEHVPYETADYPAGGYTLNDKFHMGLFHSREPLVSEEPSTPAGYGNLQPGDGFPAGWVQVGMEWSAERQRFFVNGGLVWERTTPAMPGGLDLRLTAEIQDGNPTNIWGHPVGAFADNPPERLANCEMLIDWVGVWRKRTEIVIPPTAKPTDAPVLQSKGLSLIWQDPDVVRPLENFFDPYPGNRYGHCDFSPSICRLRVTPQTYDGKACLGVNYAANDYGILNFRAQYLPQVYREMGLCVDFIYPAGFDLQNTAGGNTSGKSLFGLLCGHPDHQKPGLPSYPRAWTGAVQWPEDQWGAELGINWTYRASNPGGIEFDWYPHVIGAYVNGADRFRQDKFSNLFNIPGYAAPAKQRITTGVWHRLEIYARMDTNRRDGVLEMWVDGTLRAQCPNLDLGGWVGNRGLAQGTVGGADSAGTGQLVGASGGGWRLQGLFIREMIGGYTLLTPDLIPKFGGSYYSYNWRLYGKV